MSRSTCSIACLLAALLVAAEAGAQPNLFEDPSFESPMDRNRWGHVFNKWQGNIYDPPGYFEASRIARTGKYSCAIVADLRSKIRMYSPEIPLQPGRYRVQVYLRGMDIGKGIWGQNLDFSCGFDDKWFNVKKDGVFGWTPLAYVFQVTPQQAAKPFRLFVGLWGGGRLWIDDASLQAVDASVPLTPEPVLGKEEAPFTSSPAPRADAVRCAVCAWRVAPTAQQCDACGHAIAPRDNPASAGPAVKLIADFEKGIAPFAGGRHTTQDAPQGKGALLLESNHTLLEAPQDWSGYDYIRIDTYNPSDKPVPMYMEVRDRQTTGYWTRVNQNTVVPPGRSTLSFRTDLYVGEKSRPGRALVRNQITHLFFNVEKGSVILDNIRLERLDRAAIGFPGLLALDFGPLDGPLMEGFAPGITALPYHPRRGYGWVNSEFWRSFNVLQPDALTQDFVTPTNATFRVDLPDGRYRVLLNLDSAGGYWGEPQVYSLRQLRANGRIVAEDRLDFASFVARYFRNADREDSPGLDTFDQYVQRMFNVKAFDVDVSGGRLELAFKGESWANCLSWLVIYPAARAAEGQKFLDWVTAQRRNQFNDYFKQVEPKRAPKPAAPYVLFTRHMALPVQPYDGPAEGEALPSTGLSLSLARGEEMPLTFAIQPGADLGAIDLAFSPFVNEKGERLDPAAFQAGWIQYKLSRLAMDGSVYTVAPRYWRPTPAPAAPGITRRFWVRVKAPAGVAGGVYRGAITVKPASAPSATIPVALRILPFALDPISDVAVGPWGSGINIAWDGDDPRTRNWNAVMFEKALDVLRDGGCTSFSGRPTLRAKAENGRITLDTAEADREMQLIRAKGFRHVISGYGANISLGYRTYGTGSGPDEDAAREAGFPSFAAFLTALYTAIDRHALQHDWTPIAWNLCDEPIGDDIPPAVANAKAHRAIAGSLQRQSFMGATSMEGNDPKNPHYELVTALPVPSLNLHDEASLGVIRAAGNRFSFYNGGNRWTYGRYMKMLVVKHALALRLSWHFNVVAGDPYYALDAREDDYCWFNTDARQTMIPSMDYLAQILPGLNDYRYLSTLQRLVAERPNHPQAAAARKVLDEMLNLRAGADRRPPGAADDETPSATPFDSDRQRITSAIESLLAAP